MKFKLGGLLGLILFVCLGGYGSSVALAADSNPIEAWHQDAYRTGNGVTEFEVVATGGPDGGPYWRIKSNEPNDARWVKTFAVVPETYYRLHAFVRAEAAVGADRGANLSVLGIVDASEDFVRTDGKWLPIEYVGKTGADQTSLTVAMRLGGYGYLTAGTAEFSGFELAELGQAPPEGVEWDYWYPHEDEGTDLPVVNKNNVGMSTLAFDATVYAMDVFGCLAGVWFVLRPSGRLTPKLKGDERTYGRALWIVFCAGVALRLGLSVTVKGHPIDMLDFGLWADRAYSGGLGGFFDAGMFADYPPGYIYALYAIGALREAFGLTASDSPASWLLIKLPAIAADLAISCLIVRESAKRWNRQAALTLAVFMACNPMLIVDSSSWGQADSVLALFSLLFILALTRGRTTTAALWLMIACLVKPQAILLAPLLVFVLWKREAARQWMKAISVAMATLVVAVMPFAALREPAGLWEHYRAMFASYPYASLNAANIYGLLGLNGTTNGHWIGPMTVKVWSDLFTIGIVLFAWALYRRLRAVGQEAEGIPVVAFAIAVLVFTLRSGMHERYGYVAAVLAVLACVFVRSVKFRAIAASFTIVQFANIAYALHFALGETYYVPASDAFFRFLSLLEVILAGWVVYESWRLTRNGEVRTSVKKASVRKKERIPTQPIVRALTRQDAVIMAVLTLLSVAVTFFRLGAADAPSTMWKPAASAAVEVGFTRTEHVAQLLVYGGLGKGSLDIESTMDGARWNSEISISNSDATVFQWQRIPVGFEANAVRVRAPADGGDAGFYELALFNAEGQRIPTSSSDVPALFDEPDTVPTRPSYLNGMYFDEIYHARTAYENVHGLEAYETTHPPLGKLIMAFGVTLFGMNPFGWRCMGALFGVAMVPLLYALGKRLFGHTGYAALSAGLLALDCMHFALSRLGTVDIFAAFFILLAAASIYDYYRLSVIQQSSFSRTLVPLSLASLSVGMAIATKWIGLYAGAGIAVALIAIWRSDGFPRGRYVRTIGWTFALFTLVPLVVYAASYIPYMLLPGPGHGFEDVITYQKFMFDYHNGLVATHPFSSRWWEWPLIRKPVWIYMGATDNEKLASSIVLIGNPAIWWAGSAAVVYMIVRFRQERDMGLRLMFIAWAAQLVPWIFVSRLTFIYHFFACVPFLILIAVYAIRSVGIRTPKLSLKPWIYVFVSACLALFLLFYPILSGTPVDKAYIVHALKWSKGWIFHV